MEQDENSTYDDEEENGNSKGFCSWDETQYTFGCFQQEDEHKL